MIAFSYYLLKVIICSGILFLYYHIALRNKSFHQWNRFYLLFSIFVALVAPVVQVGIVHYTSEDSNKAIQILKVLQSGDGFPEEVRIHARPGFSSEQRLIMAYVVISVLLVTSLILSLLKIGSIIRNHSIQWIERIKFVSTRIAGTPFSFFNFIFWNEDIDLQTETGKQIFQHELVHVKEKHTVDKIIIQLVLTVFWCNPFFWLIRNELKLIHEFIADKKSVGEQGTAALAAMILKATYPTQFNSITNQFFQTSIKRRLMMLTKIENPRIKYLSRVLALPILAAIIFAFTLRAKKIVISNSKLDKEITVVVDAGHGRQDGHHTGAQVGDVYEDEITLSIANKIKGLNTDSRLKIVLTRTSQDIVDLHKRVDIAKDSKADLFISIHVNAAPPSTATGNSPEEIRNKGLEVMVGGAETPFQSKSETLASVIQQELSSIYLTAPSVIKANTGVWVLNHNVCPSVLIECGYITDKSDKEFLTKETNQVIVAQKILLAIERYAMNQQESKGLINDTSPQQQRLVKEARIKNANASSKNEPTTTELRNWGKPPLIIVDGKELSKTELDKIDPETIESMSVLKGDTATAKYGKKGINGAIIEITLKKSQTIREVTVKSQPGDTIPKTQPLFTKVEVEPTIDKAEWLAFLRKNLQSVIEKATAKGINAGTYVVKLRFIVKQDGTISNIEALNDPGYDFAANTVAFMKNSPKWKPALQNGKAVNAYHTQPVTFVIADN